MTFKNQIRAQKIRSWLAFLLTCQVMVVQATEGGGSNYLPGFYGDFGMAVFPGTGTYFNNFFAAYRDETNQTGTLLEMPGLIRVMEQEFLDAHYVVGAFPALMASQDTTGDNHYDRVALGDFYFVPGGLSWDWGDVKLFLFEGMVAPTGRYQVGEFNTGRNYWTFDHNVLFTWTLPADNELSFAIGYMNNLENPATDYQSGDEFHFDFNFGHYIGPVAIGVSGSHYRQVSKDNAPETAIVPDLAEASTIGPSLMYVSKFRGKDAAFSVKWLHEYDVAGRVSQEYLVARIQIAF